MTDYNEVVTRAKVRLQGKAPFFSYLLQQMKITIGDKVHTAGVNAYGDMYFNPEFINHMPEEVLTGLMLHEVMHVALGHLERSVGYDIRLANIAQDIVINDILVTEDFELPQGGYIPKTDHTIKVFDHVVMDIDRKSWEEIYFELLPHDDGVSTSPDVLIYPDGEPVDGDGTKPIDAKHLLSDAYSFAKMQGKVPNSIEERLGKLLAPKIDWKQVLQDYLSNMMPVDYSFYRPSKRFLANGIVMPGVEKEGLRVAVCLDTSGSINVKDLIRFASETLGIALSFGNVKLHLLQADTEVQSDVAIDSEYQEALEGIEVKGRGGTSHVQLIEHLEKEHHDIDVAVFFTDGYTDFPDIAPTFDCVWASTTKGIEYPFGKVIYVGSE
jgi:predicted metal-dependent peptidase